MRLYILSAIILLTGCIKQVHPEYRQNKPLLVVEGLLLTDSTPCTVTLSYSGIFNENGAQLQDFIDDATIILYNKNLQDSVELISSGKGQYKDAFHRFYPKPNETYFITIYLSSGERYVSQPETIVPLNTIFDIDTVAKTKAIYPPQLNAADVQIRFRDDASQDNYYRWITTDYLPRKATGVSCGFSCIKGEFCYQLNTNLSDINIMSDALVNGSEIRNKQVLNSPYYWYGNHFIDIKQLSLTRQAYSFWNSYLQQTTRTGGIFDPLPGPVTGNIYNMDRPDEFALGFFECSDVVSRKYIIRPTIYNDNLVLQYVNDFIPVGECNLVLPNAQLNAPAGWANAQEVPIDVY